MKDKTKLKISIMKTKDTDKTKSIDKKLKGLYFIDENGPEYVLLTKGENGRYTIFSEAKSFLELMTELNEILAIAIAQKK